MIESDIHNKILPDRIRDGPQIPNCISVDEWLREMPEFACDCQPSQWMRNREGLAELSSAYSAFSLFGKNAVDVEVETCEVVTQQDQCTIPERADVDFRRGARVETANVAEANGRFVSLAGQYDFLKSGEDLAGTTA